MKSQSIQQQTLAFKNWEWSSSFESLSLFQTGPHIPHNREPTTSVYGAKFHIQNNISFLFPYINEILPGAQYYSVPQYIKFKLADHLCALYPNEGIFAPVKNHIDAVDYLRTLLKFIQKTFQNQTTITPNDREYTPVSAVDIYKLLPGSNCRECGFQTCMAFAAALARQQTSLLKCPYLERPIEEKSTFRMKDRKGQITKTISLNVDTDSLRKEVTNKDRRIDELQAKLEQLEKNRVSQISSNNQLLPSPLTNREIEVLQILAKGATNKEISNQLFISGHTVKTHINHIFDKLGVNDRTQASVWAALNNIL
jgi:DNA-binding CsgD family transcriptional regulator/ArsR family metal-binding transcriptional regulator